MNQVEFIKRMEDLARRHRKRIFSLREIAAWIGLSRPAAGMLLLRAAGNEIVFRVGTLWVNGLSPPSLLELALALKSPSYLSFESALYHHNRLSQSPRGGLTLATAGRPRRFETPLGAIQLIHLKPSLFFGYTADRIAHPEKAWLDLLYIRGRKGRLGLVTEEFYLKGSPLGGLNRKRLAEFAKRFPPWVREVA